jgi:hypothetical protein
MLGIETAGRWSKSRELKIITLPQVLLFRQQVNSENPCGSRNPDFLGFIVSWEVLFRTVPLRREEYDAIVMANGSLRIGKC